MASLSKILSSLGNTSASLAAWVNSSSPCLPAPSLPNLVTCGQPEGDVVALDLRGLSPLPTSVVPVLLLTPLSNLSSLVISGLGLKGPIPGGLATLSSLRVIDISHNSFSPVGTLLVAGWWEALLHVMAAMRLELGLYACACVSER